MYASLNPRKIPEPPPTIHHQLVVLIRLNNSPKTNYAKKNLVSFGFAQSLLRACRGLRTIACWRGANFSLLRNSALPALSEAEGGTAEGLHEVLRKKMQSTILCTPRHCKYPGKTCQVRLLSIIIDGKYRECVCALFFADG